MNRFRCAGGSFCFADVKVIARHSHSKPTYQAFRYVETHKEIMKALTVKALGDRIS
jgi:hypothetical protein